MDAQRKFPIVYYFITKFVLRYFSRLREVVLTDVSNIRQHHLTEILIFSIEFLAKKSKGLKYLKNGSSEDFSHCILHHDRVCFTVF